MYYCHTSQTSKGLILALVAGLLMMWFSPLVNKVIDMSFMPQVKTVLGQTVTVPGALSPKVGMMTPYTAFFVFAIGIFLSNFVWNTFAMRKPVSGEPVAYAAYFRGGFPIHLVGALGGCIWGLGTLLSFVTAGAAGKAIAYALGQGATLVSALWGILIWREFKGAPKSARLLNVVMFALFVAGLAALIKAGA